MSNLSLLQCDNCGYAEFGIGYNFADGARVEMGTTGASMSICGHCVRDLLSRHGAYELTGDAKTPVKPNAHWAPVQEQTSDPKRSY